MKRKNQTVTLPRMIFRPHATRDLRLSCCSGGDAVPAPLPGEQRSPRAPRIFWFPTGWVTTAGFARRVSAGLPQPEGAQAFRGGPISDVGVSSGWGSPAEPWPHEVRLVVAQPVGTTVLKSNPTISVVATGVLACGLKTKVKNLFCIHWIPAFAGMTAGMAFWFFLRVAPHAVGPGGPLASRWGDWGATPPMKKQMKNPLFFVLGLMVLFASSAWGAAAPKPLPRLCAESAAPDDAPDKHFIRCRLDSGSYAPAKPPAPKKNLKVAAFNLAAGHALADLKRIMTTDPDLKDVDVWLLSEADRGCQHGDKSPHVAAELAGALKMHWVYAVEFMEVDFASAAGPVQRVCEHGNAILSRYPLKNAHPIRHRAASKWYEPPAQRAQRGNAHTRLGGRVALSADVMTAKGAVRVYSLHLENSALANFVRVKQSGEVIADAQNFTGPVVVGGDLNTDFYYNDLVSGIARDPTPKTYAAAGYADAHAALPASARATNDGKTYGPQTWDLIFLKKTKALKSGVCPLARCGGPSDHLPVWTVLD